MRLSAGAGSWHSVVEGAFWSTILYRREKILGQSFQQLVVPKGRRSHVLKVGHETYRGHMSVKKTKAVYLTHFFGLVWYNIVKISLRLAVYAKWSHVWRIETEFQSSRSPGLIVCLTTFLLIVLDPYFRVRGPSQNLITHLWLWIVLVDFHFVFH